MALSVKFIVVCVFKILYRLLIGGNCPGCSKGGDLNEKK